MGKMTAVSPKDKWPGVDAIRGTFERQKQRMGFHVLEPTAASWKAGNKFFQNTNPASLSVKTSSLQKSQNSLWLGRWTRDGHTSMRSRDYPQNTHKEPSTMAWACKASTGVGEEWTPEAPWPA